MVRWVNRNKVFIQWFVVILGLLLLGSALYRLPATGLQALSGRPGDRTLKGLAKPAEVGIYLLVALFAVRLAFKLQWVREKGRALFRLLQVIHVPLGLVVIASAALHGLGYLLFNWKNDLHSWSGVAALALMSVAVIFGLRTVKRPGRKRLHLILGLLTFAVTMLHIFVEGGEGPDGRQELHDRRPPRGTVTTPQEHK